jgi:acylpyruvate hydrolase
VRLATVSYEGRSHAARVEDDHVDLLPAADVGALLAAPGGLEAARGAVATAHVPRDAVRTETLVPRPPKVLCIGQNYLKHIEETGSTRPDYPTVFAKFTRALIGDGDSIILPSISSRVDWEVELVVVIGREVRDAGAEEAAAAIGGFTVGNDISARDLQGRTSQWLQGKTCESTTPVGPCLTTTDVTGVEPDLAISCAVDGVVRQQSRTSDLLFKPVALVEYLSHIITLDPGDLIFTGTPGGVGQGMSPPVFLQEGQTVTSSIESIGSLVNRCRAA